MASGTFVVFWYSYRFSQKIKCQPFFSDGTYNGIAFQINKINGASNPSTSRLPNGNVAIVWLNSGMLYGQILTSSLTLLTGSDVALTGTGISANIFAYFPMTSRSDSSFILTFGCQYEIYSSTLVF